MAEIVTLEEEKDAIGFRAGIGKAIAQVQLRRMAATFAVSRECRERGLGLAGRDPDDMDSGRFKKCPDVVTGLLDAGMPLSAEAECGLEDGDRGGDRLARGLQPVGEHVGVALVGQVATMAEASTNITHHR